MKVSVKTEEKQERKELREVFVLWKNTAKSGLEYLSGNAGKDMGDLAGVSVSAFFNTKKENPKQPDIQVYIKGEDGKNVEVAALWERITKNDKRIVTGLTNEKEALVGFYGKEDNDKAPYIKVYFQDEK